MTTVKTRTKSQAELPPISKEFQFLLQFFEYGWDFIIKPQGENWRTVSSFPLTPRLIERYWLNPNLVLGLRFKNFTRLGCIDLDHKSIYHPKNDSRKYRQLLKALRRIGISDTIPIQSSDSNGVHLWFFLGEEVNTFDLACGLTKTLTKAKFEIKPGQLEVFPNTKRYVKPGLGFSLYNGLRVPMQPESGARILDPHTFELIPGGIIEFAELVKTSHLKQDLKKLKKELKTARNWYLKEYKKNTNWAYEDFWEDDLRYQLEKGFTDSCQTNAILLMLTRLGRVFLGIDNVIELAKFIRETISSLPGYEKYCGHKHEITRRSLEAAKSGMNFWQPWKKKPEERTENYQEIRSQLETLVGEGSPEGTRVFKGFWSRTNQERYNRAVFELGEVLKAYPVSTMPVAVGERLRFINEKRKEWFGNTFSRTTMMKFEYAKYWHSKYVMTGLPIDSAVAQAKPLKTVSKEYRLVDLIFVSSLAKNFLSAKITKIENQSCVTKERRAKVNTGQSIQETIAPSKCNIGKKELSEIAVIQTTQIVPKNDRTLMKGCVAGPRATPHIAYSNFVLRLETIKKRILLEAESLEFSDGQPSKNITQTEISHFQQKHRTSKEKITEIKRAKRSAANGHFYNGPTLNSRSASTRKQKFETLCPGDKVKVSLSINDFHSSTLVDDSRDLIVYVKPIKEKSSKKKYPVLLDSLLVCQGSASYSQAIYRRIKELAQSLGLKKLDYLEFLRNRYSVDSISQLAVDKQQEVFSHYHNLSKQNQKRNIAKLKV